MTVEKERSDQLEQDANRWVVNLGLDLPRLGPVLIRISLLGHSVSTCFFSDSASTRAIIERAFDTLNSKLAQRGTSV